jgi:hypothetical protein
MHTFLPFNWRSIIYEEISSILKAARIKKWGYHFGGTEKNID